MTRVFDLIDPGLCATVYFGERAYCYRISSSPMTRTTFSSGWAPANIALQLR